MAQSTIDAGLLVLDTEKSLKVRDLRQAGLRCIAEPLMQEGHALSNLLVSTVANLVHSFRGVEGSPLFVADALQIAHATALPRLLLVELGQTCNPKELTSQGAFQRALGAFVVAISDRLPHVFLANISVLLPLLDVDCYPLRSAIVESIEKLLSAEGRALPRGARCNVVVAEEEAPAEPDAGDSGEAGAGEAERVDSVALAGGRFAIAAATKKDLLETLLARSTDKTAWVRVKTLTSLTHLASNTRIAALPREQWPRVMEIATKRMQDSGASVRKVAMQLVWTLIKLHPYGPALNGSGSERAKAEQLVIEVAARMKKLNAEEMAEEAAKGGAVFDAGDDADPNPVTDDAAGAANKRRRLTKKNGAEETPAEEVERCLAAELVAEKETAVEDAEEVRGARQRQRLALQRMQECFVQRLQFVELIDSAEARLRALLGSRCTSDVTEAINVVVELRLRGLPAAARAFNQVLGLVWSRTEVVKEAAVEAFHRMHLDGRDSMGIVSSLLEMYGRGCEGAEGSWTHTHLASVQELIQEAAKAQLVRPTVLVPEFVDALPSKSCPHALRALAAFGGADCKELERQLPKLAELFRQGGAATGDSGPTRLARMQLLCQVLQRLFACRKGHMTAESWAHVAALSHSVTHVIVEFFSRGDLPPQWFGTAQAAVDLSFELAAATDPETPKELRCPDKLWEQIVERMFQNVFGRHHSSASGAAGPGAEVGALVAFDDGAPASSATVVEVSADAPAEASVSTLELSAALFLAGHLSLRMLVFLETMHGGLKKKRMAEEDAKMADQREAKKEGEAKKAGKKKKGEKVEEEEPDEGTSLGMAGTEEREAEAFAELAESGLLYGRRSLLDKAKPLILSGLFDPEQRVDPVLRRCAAISLCKFMTVSKRFCEEHLQLLFSLLFPKTTGRSAALVADAADMESFAQDVADSSQISDSMAAVLEDRTLRQSLLVAVGDLLFRHPNVVEPWTGRLYDALGVVSPPGASEAEVAGSAELRLTALLVLTHLVLNDMMKPRPVLLVRALWLTACPHLPTSRVSRILFHELAKKTTCPIYNLAPFIIGLLPENRGPQGLAEGSSEDRVKYLMQFIEKEKHVEGLIEKLTVRLAQSADISGSASASTKPTDETAVDEDGTSPTHSLEMVSCLASALGAMNYADRSIGRLHDVIVVRRTLNVAISYHAVVRENLLAIVERTRRAKSGKAGAAGDAPAVEVDPAAAAPESASGKGGVSAAVAEKLDAIEQLVTSLADGCEESNEASNAAVPLADDSEPAAAPASADADALPADADVAAVAAVPTPAAAGAGKRKGASKRKAEVEEADGGEEVVAAAPVGKGKGRGRGAAKVAGAAGGRGKALKKRRTGGDDDDEE